MINKLSKFPPDSSLKKTKKNKTKHNKKPAFLWHRNREGGVPAESRQTRFSTLCILVFLFTRRVLVNLKTFKLYLSRQCILFFKFGNEFAKKKKQVRT